MVHRVVFPGGERSVSMIGGMMRATQMMMVAVMLAAGGAIASGPEVSAAVSPAAWAASAAGHGDIDGGDGHVMVLSIGDSYIAGTGADNYYPGQGPGYDEPAGVKRVPGSGANCYQSYSSYPWQYVQVMRDRGGAADIWHAACHGAWTYDLWDQFWTIPADFRAQSDVLLVSAGGNDVGFSSLVAHCLLGLHEWMPGVSTGTCDDDLDHARTELPRMLGTLESSIADISPHLPKGSVVAIVGYPNLNSPGCLTARGEDQLAAIQADHEAALVEMAWRLNRSKANRKQRIDYRVVLPAVRFQGHGPCASSSNRWIHHLSTTEGHSFHPNWTGSNQYANVIQDSLG